MLSWDKTPSLAPMRCCRAWVEINLTALAHNVRQLRQWLMPTTELMAVVKADAYGHGAVTIARHALKAGAHWCGVATVPEGIELRQAGIQAPILLMGAVHSLEEVRAIAQWQLQPTLVAPKQALVFSETLGRLDHPLPVHLKLDTGMSRLGHPWQQAVEFVQFVQQLPGLAIASVYSHLATADDPDTTVLQQQHHRFQTAIEALTQHQLRPPQLHLANSAATLGDTALHYDMVRVGLALYGLYPAPHLRSTISLHPVMQVKARITHIKEIAAGTGVSYGHQFVAPQPMRIAVVGIGYADGVPRALSNHMAVLVQGQQVRQVGAITMDQLMLDVTHLPGLQEGDIVTLLGHQGRHCITADDWANLSGTISWEILCGFKHRLPRVALEQPLTALATSRGS
ncbi:Alanine racemase [Halomicronema hongdechloris C2206]|uniref:Alanine racemase n=1 Tax=Halomicronema hongdechloris C2206 TaxID=1641165 RepID=A0A1Z3HI72_9CYAN|nr:alanine racemase [Halomicronema hongdechloris]ASC70019.1 Alanine racemase [Halomicronema hongdechloris C2206]